MSLIAALGDQSSSSEITALTNLTELSISGTNQFLRKTGALTFENATPTEVGFGNVVGPDYAVNNRLAVFNGTTGKLIKDSGVAYTEITFSPLANTANYIPQWDGANSKTLKNGLAVPAGGLAGLTALGLKADTTALASYLPLAGGTMTGGITNSTSVNPLTTLAESWIGPSSTTGVYFKGGNVGIGTTSPQTKLALSSGSEISFEASAGVTDIALTHSADTLTLSGGNLALGANNLTMTGSLGATGAGKLTKVWTTDAEITNLPTINGGTLASALSLGTMASAAT